MELFVQEAPLGDSGLIAKSAYRSKLGIDSFTSNAAHCHCQPITPLWPREAGLLGNLTGGLGIVSEAGSGIIRYYLTGDTDSPEQFEQGVTKAIKRLRAFAQEAEGSLVVLEAPPGIKSKVDVWGSVGNALPLMRGLKEQFDPDRVLNPGRFVGGI